MVAVGRIVQAGDFQAVLGTAAKARSEHFTLHHMAVLPLRLPNVASVEDAAQHKLSTVWRARHAKAAADAADRPALGLVVPKRHARRSVTRTLLKRQMRAAMQRHAVGLVGWWVVRLRAAFPVAQFRSAASDPLRRAASAELDALFIAGRRRLGLAPVSVLPAPIPCGVLDADSARVDVGMHASSEHTVT